MTAPTPQPHMLAAALWYARRGFYVFPVFEPVGSQCSCANPKCEHVGKHPRSEHGWKDATTDPNIITGWWERCPHASIAIACGPSGLAVLDHDVRASQISRHVDLREHVRRKYGPLPDTCTVLTGSADGSTHDYYRYAWSNGDRTPSELEPGLDLKGAGGYVIAPPSRHYKGGVYEVDGLDGAKAFLKIAAAPDWLVTLIRTPVAKPQPNHQTEQTRKIREGEGRNKRLISVIGTLRKRGMTEAAILAAALEEDRTHHDPPLGEDKVGDLCSRYAGQADPEGEPGPEEAGAEDWPELIPFAQHEPDVIPIECLPEWLGEMARATSENTETPFALPALMGTAVASASIAAKAAVSPEDGYSEPLNLHVCPAMESGNRKTAVVVQLLAPFTEWESEMIAKTEPERQRLASERRTTEARIDRLRKQAASAEHPGALLREIRQLEENVPKVPPVPRLFVDDCTPEQLAPLMAEQGERMAVFSDEGGIFDILAGRYSKGVPNLDLWLKGHSVSPVRVDRVDRTRPPVLLARPHLTVGISPQPDVLASLHDKPGFRGRGVLARFLYGLPPSPLGYRTLEPHPVPSDVAQRYRRGIQQLLEFTPEKEIQLRLSAAAYQEWKEFQRSLEIQFREGGLLCGLTDWGSKLAGAVLRLAGVFHAVKLADRITAEPEISKDTMRLALDLGAHLISHARAAFTLMERDPVIEHAERLIGWMLRKSQPTFTVRDCFRGHQQRFKRVDALLPVLLLLERHGYIRREQPESRGGQPPSEVCQVNPALLKGKRTI